VPQPVLRILYRLKALPAQAEFQEFEAGSGAQVRCFFPCPSLIQSEPFFVVLAGCLPQPTGEL